MSVFDEYQLKKKLSFDGAKKVLYLNLTVIKTKRM